MAMEDALSSLDGARLSRRHVSLYGITVLGHICDGFDVNLMGFLVPSLIVAFGLTDKSAGFLVSAVFFGMMLGSLIGGQIADRIGRKTTMVGAMLFFGVFGLAAAAAPTYWSLWAFRFIAGIGLGAEIFLAFAYLVEYLPVKNRGFWGASSQFFWQVSSLVAALIAIPVIPLWGWRGMLVVGALLGLASGIVWWFALPESVRYLLEKGKFHQAQKVVQRISALNVDLGEKAADTTQARAITPQRSHLRVSALLGRRYARHTIGVWIIMFCQSFTFIGMVAWMPSIFLKEGFSFVHSFLFVATITGAGAIGNVAGSVAIDRWGRRPTLIFYFFASTVTLVAWGFSSGAVTVVTIGAISAFFTFGCFGPLFVWVSEIYPTELRGTGNGFAGAAARAGGIVSPFVLGIIIGLRDGHYILFGVVAGLMCVTGIAAVVAIKETRHQTLEKIQEDVASDIDDAQNINEAAS